VQAAEGGEIMRNLNEAIKALRLTDDTVLFVDMEQIPIDEFRKSLLRAGVPSGTLICAVKGQPNVEAMSQEQLVEILNQKIALSKNEDAATKIG
jgi:hypothetical protein